MLTFQGKIYLFSFFLRFTFSCSFFFLFTRLFHHFHTPHYATTSLRDRLQHDWANGAGHVLILIGVVLPRKYENLDASLHQQQQQQQIAGQLAPQS